jgi:hypothetical protein
LGRFAQAGFSGGFHQSEGAGHFWAEFLGPLMTVIATVRGDNGVSLMVDFKRHQATAWLSAKPAVRHEVSRIGNTFAQPDSISRHNSPFRLQDIPALQNVSNAPKYGDAASITSPTEKQVPIKSV